MSDQFQDFDQLFRDRLKDQTATPPDSVWSNIQAERTFGHIVANKISSSWRIIGTLLLLALAGGTSALLISSEESDTLLEQDLPLLVSSDMIDQNDQSGFNSHAEVIRSISYQEAKVEVPIAEIEVVEEENNIAPDLIASAEGMSFSRPDFGDTKLDFLISEMDGWGTAKPSSLVKFYHLSEIDKRKFDGNKLVKAPLYPEKLWDYVVKPEPELSFKERSSIIVYAGPQFINKVLRAKYNLESSLLEQKQDLETNRFAYTVGAAVQYDLKKHKFIESGLQFTQIFEEVKINGNTKFSNQYDFLEVPLLFGYQDRESKWGWFVKGGIGVHIYNNYEGYIYKNVEQRLNVVENVNEVRPEEHFRVKREEKLANGVINTDHQLSNGQDPEELFDLSKENPYKKNGIFNLHLAAGLTYYHSIKTSFYLTPTYRQSLNSITKPEAQFDERINYIGVLFGTQVKF